MLGQQCGECCFACPSPVGVVTPAAAIKPNRVHAARRESRAACRVLNAVPELVYVLFQPARARVETGKHQVVEATSQ